MSKTSVSKTGDTKANGRAEISGMIGVSVASLLGLVVTLVAGDAPLTHYVSDWVNWARLSPLYAALAIFTVLLSLFGAVGAVYYVLRKKRRDGRRAVRALSAGNASFSDDDGVVASEALTVPDDKQMAVLRAGNDFSVDGIPDLPPSDSPVEATPTPEGTSPRLADSDDTEQNSQSQNSGDEEAPLLGSDETLASPFEAPAPEPVTDSESEPSEDTVPAEVIATEAPPIAPLLLETTAAVDAVEPASDQVPVGTETDTVENDATTTQELLAFAVSAATPEGEESAPQAQAAAAEPESTQAAETDHASEVARAVQTALSVWPDSTRSVAAHEVTERIASLYINKSEATQSAFNQIASGELNGAASTLGRHAQGLAEEGKTSDAAEIWRIVGALFMGRDDDRALEAYSKVSELDANDGNIHLFLARRYIQSGDLTKLPAVAERALAVIGDPAIRAELLVPYASQMVKSGDAGRAAGAFEELKDYRERESAARPDDLMARSTYAVSLAQLAQSYETLGGVQLASEMYRKAHLVFLELTERLPEHTGLKSMADSALRDAVRLSEPETV